jgi:hypothetical protein
MLYYETIPAIVIDSVRSLYRTSYVDTTGTTARLIDVLDSSVLSADMALVLSQFATVISVALGAFIAFVMIQKRALKSRASQDGASAEAAPSEVAPVPAGVLRDRWNTILSHLDSVRESDWKHAVMEADKLVDDSLARAGFGGATFGDRLSNIKPGTLLSLDGVWWAHKIRNRLAHEIDYFLRYTEARQAVGYYEAALAELQLI